MIGLIGCGQMGRGIARNLLGKGQTVVAFDVSAAALADVASLGAQTAPSIAILCEQARTVITCLPTIDVVEEVYEGKSGESSQQTLGLLAVCRPGTLLIETSSSRPALSRRIGEAAQRRGVQLIDAPLVGTAVEAWDATLTILAGGAAEDIERARPVLESISHKIIRFGELGQAHLLKSLNNAVAMTNHAILCEAFAVAEDLGLDLSLVFEVLRSGFAASRKLEDVAPKLISGNHPRRAVMRTPLKDLGIFKELAEDTSTMTPVLEAALGSYRTVCRLGAGGEPPSRLADIIRLNSGALAALIRKRASDQGEAPTLKESIDER